MESHLSSDAGVLLALVREPGLAVCPASWPACVPVAWCCGAVLCPAPWCVGLLCLPLWAGLVRGWGLHIQSEALAKFGLLLLNRGGWEGRQLLPASWVEQMMTRKIGDYGYQMWLCEYPGAVRADGALGQYILIVPDKDMVVVITEWDIPCVIFCRDLRPDDSFLKIAEEKNIPVLGTKRSTSEFMAELIYCLNEQLAPCITIHGVLVDVYGEGLLIMGESGIGKSEAALELIKRGHRLVTDDVVEIRKINEHTLIGTSPDITRYFIELRGIGIIDVKTLFGVECVKEKQQIDLVIKLEDWKKENEYDRLGLEEEYTEFLGNKVVCHSLPIRPGRNLAVICEAAAVNHRQKKMGYNAAQELYRRVQENLTKKSSDDDE